MILRNVNAEDTRDVNVFIYLKKLTCYSLSPQDMLWHIVKRLIWFVGINKNNQKIQSFYYENEKRKKCWI